MAEVGLHDSLEIGAVADGFADQVRICVQYDSAGGIHDGSVVDNRPATDHRFQHGIQIAIRAQVVRNSSAHRLRVLRVYFCAGKVGGSVGRQ